ncbi:hypothetical protein [Bradyrhizobium sp. RDM12]
MLKLRLALPSPDESDRREAWIAKRFDRIVHVLEHLERKESVTFETITLG